METGYLMPTIIRDNLMSGMSWCHWPNNAFRTYYIYFAVT